MNYVNPDIVDAGLTHYAARATGVYLCDQYPATYEQATGAYALGYKIGVVPVGPYDRDGGGREMRIQAFSSGVAVRAGVPVYYAVVDSNTGARLTAGEVVEPVEIILDQPVRIASDVVLQFPLANDDEI